MLHDLRRRPRAATKGWGEEYAPREVTDKRHRVSSLFRVRACDVWGDGREGGRGGV